MNILWLTIDRSSRVASHIFTPLQKEVSKIVNVDLRVRKINKVAGSYCSDAVNGLVKPDPMVRIKEAKNYDLIFTDAIFAFLTEDWKNIKTPKAVLMEDQHGDMVKKYIGKAYNEFGFTVFFTRYNNPTKTYHRYLYNRKVFWLPHSIDPELFKDYGQEKTIGLLNIGRMNNHTYKIRNKIHDVLKKQSYYKRVGRPAESLKGKKWPVGADYAKLINSAKMASTCTSRLNYPVLKFFEIPACNTALVCNEIKELNKLGFEANKNFIPISMKINIRKIVEEYLNNDGKRKEIAYNGMKLIQQRHTAKTRAEEFVNYVNKALKK